MYTAIRILPDHIERLESFATLQACNAHIVAEGLIGASCWSWGAIWRYVMGQ